MRTRDDTWMTVLGVKQFLSLLGKSDGTRPPDGKSVFTGSR